MAKAKTKKQLDREIAEVLARRKTLRKAKTRVHAAKATVDVDELIASDDPADWSVARDLALQENDQELIVLLDMARALDVPPNRLHVDKASVGYEVRLGKQEYAVVPDEDTAVNLAMDIVQDDIKREPGMFESRFIEDFINEKKLKKWVYDAMMEDDYVDELARYQADDFWELARQLDVTGAVPDTDDDGNLMEPTRKQIAAVKKARATDTAKHPMRYFDDMNVSHEEAVKQAIKAVGIDVKAAAEAAIRADGWERWLAYYDGTSHTTDSGLVYWRLN